MAQGGMELRVASVDTEHETSEQAQCELKCDYDKCYVLRSDAVQPGLNATKFSRMYSHHFQGKCIPCEWKEYVPPKRCQIYTRLYGASSQKTVFFRGQSLERGF